MVIIQCYSPYNYEVEISRRQIITERTLYLYKYVLSFCPNSKIELSTTHGYQFNNYFFVGGGVAFNYYTDADLYAAPIYANFRANFINKKVTPFADVKAGYAVGDIEGAYASIGVGVRFSLKGKKALNLALMYNFQDYDATTDYSYSYGGHYYHNSWNDTWELHGVGARFGFEF